MPSVLARASTSSADSQMGWSVFVTVRSLQGCKNPNIARLKLVGGIRGQATQSDVVFEIKLQNFKGLVCPKAVAY
jgi:hypothetical protein